MKKLILLISLCSSLAFSNTCQLTIDAKSLKLTDNAKRIIQSLGYELNIVSGNANLYIASQTKNYDFGYSKLIKERCSVHLNANNGKLISSYTNENLYEVDEYKDTLCEETVLHVLKVLRECENN